MLDASDYIAGVVIDIVFISCLRHNLCRRRSLITWWIYVLKI